MDFGATTFTFFSFTHTHTQPHTHNTTGDKNIAVGVIKKIILSMVLPIQNICLERCLRVCLIY